MKKIYRVMFGLLVVSVCTTFLSAATAAVQGGISLPMKSEVYAPQGGGVSEEDIKQEMLTSSPLISDQGMVRVLDVTPTVKPSGTITTVEEMKQFMRAFKEAEIASIQNTLLGLEKMLYDTEKKLSDLKGLDPKSLLVTWAKIRSALDGERQVLAAVKGMPEEMAFPEEELAYGYNQSKKTIELLNSKVDKDSVVIALHDCQSHIKSTDKEKLKNAVTNGRDQLASYYELTISLYDDFVRMIDGLWLTSAHQFVKKKNEEIQSLKTVFESGSTPAIKALTGAEALLGSQKYKQRLEEECKTEEAKIKKQEASAGKIEKYRTQQKAIWQNDGAVVGKRELIEQRKADWQAAQAAEKEARSAKGENDTWIEKAIAVTNEAWDAYIKDQGRYDLEQVINKARETLREIVVQIRAIDENDLDTDASRVGIKMLLHEAGVFNQTKYIGEKALGNSFFTHVATGLSKHIALFKEMKPISSEFEMRLRAVGRMYPGIAIALPTVRWLANKYAPGIVDVWA